MGRTDKPPLILEIRQFLKNVVFFLLFHFGFKPLTATRRGKNIFVMKEIVPQSHESDSSGLKKNPFKY